MGIMYKGNCEKCGYTTQLCLGGGLFSVNLERGMSVLTQSEREKILALKEQNKIQSFRIENYIGECEECQTLTEKTVIDVTDREDRLHTFGNVCRSCEKNMKIMRNWNNEVLRCPTCKERALVLLQAGHWD